MPVYDRNADYAERPANYWLDYRVTAELAAHFELGSVRVREPGLGGNRKASERLLAMREREVTAGTWKPASVRGGERLTVAEWAPRWLAIREAEALTAPSKRALQNVHDQATRLQTYVLPVLGPRPLGSVKRDDVKQLVAGLIVAGHLAPRSIHHVYDALRSLFAHAVAAELLERSPCTLEVRMGELPKKRDKRPGWRKQALFTRGELVTLFTDDRVPIDRRTFYGLLFFAGSRFGEGAGRRVLDYDRHAQPLGRLVVATQYDDQPLKGEGPTREVPVHPFLAWMLAEWLSWGFELVMGRAPRPEDYLVPSRRWAHRSLKHMEHKLEQDLERLGLRRRTPHDLRASFITLAQEDGATRDVLELVTHRGNDDVWSGYSRYPWHVLCDHVSRLQLAPPSSPRSHFRSHAGSADLQLLETSRLSERDGRDLKHAAPCGTAGNLAEAAGSALENYAEIVGLPLGRGRAVTPGVSVELATDLARAADALRAGRALESNERLRLAAAVEAAAEAAPAPPLPAQARGGAA